MCVSICFEPIWIYFFVILVNVLAKKEQYIGIYKPVYFIFLDHVLFKNLHKILHTIVGPRVATPDETGEDREVQDQEQEQEQEQGKGF